MTTDITELLQVGANVATILAVPFAAWGVVTYIIDQAREARVEEENIYLQLNRSYDSFLDQMLAHPDVYQTDWITEDLLIEARRRLLFERLVSSLEQAYILLFATNGRGETTYMLRLQSSWADYMNFWCQRADFRALLPKLLEGEDADFSAYLMRIHDRVVRDLERKKGRSAS